MIEYRRYGNNEVQAYLGDTEEDVIATLVKIDMHHRKNFHQRLQGDYDGVSKCNTAEDKFDLERGKKIAKDRLLIKYYNDKCHDYLSYANYVQNVLDDVMKMYCKAFNTRAQYVQELQSMGLDR